MHAVTVSDGQSSVPAGADVVVGIEVDHDAVAGGVALATVRTSASRDVVLQGGEVTLGYAQFYRYREAFFGPHYTATHRRVHGVAAEALPGPTLLRGGQSVDQQVLLPVPSGPPSVSCALVGIGWSVGAHVRYEGTHRADAPARPLAVLSGGRGAVLGDVEVETGRRRDAVTLEVLTGRESLTPGAPIRGEVVVRAVRRGELETVRAELVLHQHVPHGPWLVDDPRRNPEPSPKDVFGVLQRAELARTVPVAPGQVLRWPFALEIPSDPPAPTLATGEFALRWLVRAVVVRRRARATTADLEIDVGTSPKG